MTHEELDTFVSAQSPEYQSSASAPPQFNTSQPKARPIQVAQKIGRNDPCPCGSGKKYKKCCGKNENEDI